MDKAIPFQAGDPVSSELFFDREELLEELEASAVSLKKGVHQDFALVSPRRFGKTSVFKRLCKKLGEKNIAVAYVDCSAAFPFTLKNFSSNYAERVLEAYSKALGLKFLPERIKQALEGAPDAVSAVVSSLVSKIGVEAGNFFTAWIELRAKASKNEEKFFETTVELAESFGKKTGVPCIVFIDEFQMLLELGKEDFLWALRSRIQQHVKTAYFVAGSSVGTMNFLLSDKKSAFYNLFIIRELAPFTPEQTKSFVKKRFDKTGLSIEEDALDQITVLSNGIPFYIQLLGLNAYFLCLHRKANKISSEIVREAYGTTLKNVPQLEKDFAKLTNAQRELLAAMSVKNLSKPSELSRATGMLEANASRELNKLVSFGYLLKNGGYAFQDVVFRDWIKNKFKS